MGLEVAEACGLRGVSRQAMQALETPEPIVSFYC